MQERARSRATAKPPPSRMIIHIPQPASVPTEQLDQLGLVKTPLSWPASGLRGRKYIDEISGIDSMGIWECSPGRWQRTIAQEEFAHFLKGSARFLPECGDPIDIRAGDSIWFPANSSGVWEIAEDLRKVYVIIDRPTLADRFKAWMKRMFRQWLGMPPRSSIPRGTAVASTTEPVAACSSTPA